MSRHGLKPALLFGLLPLAGCGGVLSPQGPIAAQEKAILLDSLGIMLAIIVPTILATLTFAFWFRASNKRAKYMGDWEFSGQIEMVVWAIPAMVVLLLGGIGWIGAHDLDPPKALPGDALQVQVVALDWKWLFIYPTLGIASVNELAIPAGQPVRFSITSATVMNSFMIPQLGSQIYAMHGGANHLNLQADHPGEFSGRSVHFSGDGFPAMHFQVHALDKGGFDAWVNAARAKPAMLDAATFANLSKPGTIVTPAQYHAVTPMLFEQVAFGDQSTDAREPKTDVKGGH